MIQPTLQTVRLVLRPFLPSDAQSAELLAGDARVADTTQNIPHPYPEGAARDWIATHRPGFESGRLATFAILLKETESLVGAVGLTIDGDEAELGYWVGVPYWNKGIATEATRRIIEYGFNEVGLDRISGWHLSRNPASGRVMAKAGMHADSSVTRMTDKDGRQEPLSWLTVDRSAWLSACERQQDRT